MVFSAESPANGKMNCFPLSSQMDAMKGQREAVTYVYIRIKGIPKLAYTLSGISVVLDLATTRNDDFFLKLDFGAAP